MRDFFLRYLRSPKRWVQFMRRAPLLGLVASFTGCSSLNALRQKDIQARAQDFARKFYEIAHRGTAAEFKQLWSSPDDRKIMQRLEDLRGLLPEVAGLLPAELCDPVKDTSPLVVHFKFPYTTADVHSPCHQLLLSRVGTAFKVLSESADSEAMASEVLASVAGKTSHRSTDVSSNGQTSAELARALALVGDREASGDRAEAAQRAFQLSREMSHRMGDMKTEIRALLSSAHYLISNDRFTDAQPLLVECERLAKQNHDELAIARTQIQQGRWHYLQAQYKPAFDYYRQSFNTAQKLQSARDVTRAAINLSAVEIDVGLYTAAHSHLQAAREAAAQQGDEEALAASLHNSGDLELEFGNPERALEYYKQALPIKQRLGDRKKICSTFDSMSVAYIEAGDFDRSLKSLEEAESYASDDAAKAYIYDHKGSAYAGKQDYSAAAKLHKLSIHLGEHAKDTSIMASGETNLAEALRKMNDVNGALEHYSKGEVLSRTLGAQPLLWQALANSAALHRALGNRKKAEKAATEAISVIESLRDQVPGGVLPRQDFFENKLAPYGVLMDAALNRNDARGALNFAEQARARTLLDTIQQRRKRVTSEMTASETDREEALDLNLRFADLELSDALAKKNPDPGVVAASRERLRVARQQMEAFEQELYRGKPDLAVRRGLAGWQPSEFPAQLVPEDSAVLEYAFIGSTPRVFVLRRSGNGLAVGQHALEGSASDISEAVGNFVSLLGQRLSNYQQPGNELYRKLIGPVERDLAGAKTLVIIPDGKLWQLPFGALMRGGRFWMEDVAIAYVPSLAVVQATAHHQPLHGSHSLTPRLFAMFNPAGDDYRRNAEANGLGALPDPSEPVRVLRSIYRTSGSDIVSGVHASESLFKRTAGKYDVYHLMTHSILDDRKPFRSLVLLAAEPGKEDGRLEAQEIADLRLDADLAVLSACRTLGQRLTPGEGLLGMSWAFFLAGTSHVVASQWLVEGNATNDLMVRFHRELLAEKEWRGSILPKARALQRAAMQMAGIESSRHPFYWASFEAIGTRL
jgi:CHAT domain-containing protein/tetratricopeptide (TPR) repeat protein